MNEIMERLVILLTLLLSRFSHSYAEDCVTGFSVVAPELAVPGKTTAVFVTLHGPTSVRPLNVTLRLSQDSSDEDSFRQPIETTQEIKGHGILPLEIPLDANGNFILQTLVNCTERDACELQSSSQMRLVGPVRDVIIRPAKHAYKPGEIVSFWVLALDHDLQIANEAIATISIKDPAGTKVALWYQVPLDEGIKAFSLPLSEYARVGRWLMHVEVESAEFTAPIEVSPGAGTDLPDVSAAEEHYVELRFGREMRRRYKPGLPFVGKVEAMSTEKSVRVRVKVYDNSTSIYSQDIEISAGEGTFVVPAIMADSEVIALQAELVSVEGKEIESHYVLAREPIYKWNSSSDCYLLIEGVEHTLQPEEEAHVLILSTCPCERDLHYVITTDGRVTDWAQRRYEDPVPPTTSTSSGAICRLHFSFTVRSVMAPVSQLLVYYVTPQGEPVSDVISFDVKLLNRQVYVNLEEREWWLPGQSLDLEVVAEPSSLVCLLGGRFRGSNDIKFDPRISEDRTPATETGEIDFLEAGVVFFQRRCTKKGDSGVSTVSYRQRGSGAGPSNRRRPPESLVGGAPFDQLWLWKCFNYTSEIASTGLTIPAPQEAGKWSLWALTVASGGLRFSSSVNVQVFRPLQAEFYLPPSLRVGETLEVDIKIANNLNSCMDVTALLALSEGAQFLSNGLLYVTERLRLGPQGATSLVVRLLVTTSGVKNMTVEVNGYSSPSCEGTQTPIPNATLAGAVMRSSTVMVYPEGLVRTDTESAYFCANENIIISTSDNFKYEWIGAPRNRAGVVLEIKAGSSNIINSVHIALAENRIISDKIYRLTIGDSENSVTWLGRGRHEYGVHLTSADTPQILSTDDWKTFWLSWEKATLAFGIGHLLHNNTLLKWKMDRKIKIQQIGFASAWGSTAEFRIWNFNDESGFSQVLHLDTPKSLVPGSESGELLVSGGLALPAMLKKREGWGGLSGALASLAPILKIKHLGIKANASEKKNLLENLPKYIQTILSCRKPDNSFSEHQMVGSHKSTVSILNALMETQAYFTVDPDLIQGAMRWIQSRQEDDGSFTPLPADAKLSFANLNNTDESNSTSELLMLEQVVIITAETLIAFHDYSFENSEEVYTFKKAASYLERVVTRVKSSEALAATTFALVLYKSQQARWAIQKLLNVSISEEGDFEWPHPMPKRDAADWLYEADSDKTLKEPIVVEDYKAAIYALNIFCHIEEYKLAESVARYLFYRSHMLDKHPELLYPAVRAFSHYDTLVNDRHRSLTISLATSGMELTDTLELKSEKPTQLLHLPSLPTKVFVYATGAGCATIQGKINYSTYSVASRTALVDLWSGIVQEILPDRSSVEEIEGKLPMLKIKHCFRWKGLLPSGVLRLEVSLFSGFELTSITQILVNSSESMAEMQHGCSANNIWFAIANVSTHCPICVQYIVRSTFIISSLRPAFARIYPTSREDLAAETFFHTSGASVLMKGITDDDLITWFGTNTTTANDPVVDAYQKCDITYEYTSTETPEASTVTNVNTNTPNPLSKIDDLSISTYTINVDNTSISNLSKIFDESELIIPTAIAINDRTSPLSNQSKTESTTPLTLDNIIIQDKVKVTIGNDESLQNINNHQFQNESNGLNTRRNPKIAFIIKNTIHSLTNHTSLEKNKWTTHTPANTSVVPTTTTSVKSETNLIASKVMSPIRHINTEKHNLPITLLKNKIDDEHLATFAPEIKNDRYLLLDKEELWGMLREAVSDEMNKKEHNTNTFERPKIT
ncbi:C3 and PZP-like alpha-2-macroglobulin domain-containing protein 8 isoform X2 [Photinus pyralis]|uniref:C3 and PZP-like alpha-2-macroglobulin domain-containing protein 8 isoform X2 n=1 Tax=Photinus pyralis TaxID=7054 RepID=UPI0012676925|nr:C3 and PZP-like alpha-2-macroglobulin domain-containing protein 8 isoform X2 [Photinus pyralis]